MINIVVLVSGVQQSIHVQFIYMYVFFFRFFSHLGYYRVMSRVPSEVLQQSSVVFLQRYLAGPGMAQMADSWVHPGLRISRARATERESVLEGVSWGRRELKAGVCVGGRSQ